MFKSLRIKKKLILSFVIVSLVASIAGVFSSVTCNDMNHKYSEAMVSYGFAQGDLGLLGIKVSEMNAALNAAAGYIDPGIVQEQLNLYKGYDAGLYLEKVRGTLISDKAKATFTTLENAYNVYLAEANSIASRIHPNMTQEERVAIQDEISTKLMPLFDAFYEAGDTLMMNKIELGNELNDSLSRSVLISLIIAVIVTVLAILLSLIFGTKIANGIAKPTNAIIDRLHAFKQGDISSPAPTVDSGDELADLSDVMQQIVDHLHTVFEDEIRIFSTMAIGDYTVKSNHLELYVGDLAPLLKAMRDMNSSIGSTIVQIRHSSDQVAGGSVQVATASQDLSSGATQQASSVEELAATIEEISKRINENAQSAKNASDVAGGAGQKLEICNEQMQQLIVAMQEISSCSSEIGKIIKTIEDIAFQTNILALNAAVEAARAGSAGKGFAVVADEVRNLASKSAEASKNTATLIANAIRAVENGSDILNVTATSMTSAVSQTEQAVTLLEQIGVASAEQAESVSQISIGIDQISAIVQTNSATAEEVAASSADLSNQSDALKTLVEKFKLSDDAGNAAAPVPMDQVSSAPSYSAEETDSFSSQYSFGGADKY